ncbi:MAG: UvrD-helicase domain-containing protein [Actinomycetota bacterium]|nr:UvrD-helicase domain-containing protein [Actinomycetota bacterium]
MSSSLRNLTQEQLAAVTSNERLLCIVAGPGSGKTTVLTHRIAFMMENGDIPGRNFAVITFTNAAAEQLKSRLGALSTSDVPWIGTFHAFAMSILRRFYETINRPFPKLISSRYRSIERSALSISSLDDIKNIEIKWNSTVSNLVREIETAKSRGVRWYDFEKWRPLQQEAATLPVETIALIYKKYENLKATEGKIDFDDLIFEAFDLMSERNDFAATIRWYFRSIFVDEYQDVNKPQVDLIKSLITKGHHLTVVGDPKQSIYTWNGASPSFINNFDVDFPSSSFLQLTNNFRSTPEIVQIANKIADTFSEKERGKFDPRIIANRESWVVPRLNEFESAAEEAEEIATEIANVISHGERPDEIAIIARVNSLLPVYAGYLSKAGVNHQIIGSENISTSPIVKAAINRITSTVGLRGSLPDALSEIDQVAADISEMESSGESYNLLALDFVRSFINESIRTGFKGDFGALISYFKVRTTEFQLMKKAGVTLITAHKSKGLEWDRVYVVGVEQGLFPHAKSLSEDAVEEERRLLYVAVTRARSELSISYAKRRGTSDQLRYASDFLINIESLLKSGSHRRLSPEEAAAEIRRSRELLNGGRKLPVDPEKALATIQRWRDEVSPLIGVRSLRLSDPLLGQVARHLPLSVSELLLIDGAGDIAPELARELVKVCRKIRISESVSNEN